MRACTWAVLICDRPTAPAASCAGPTAPAAILDCVIAEFCTAAVSTALSASAPAPTELLPRSAAVTLPSAICAVPTAPAASWADPTPPSAMPIVPLLVMLPPLRPVPATIAVTVPPLSLSMPSAKPCGMPVIPCHGVALAAFARSASGTARTGCRGASTV